MAGVHNAEKVVKCPHINWIFFLLTELVDILFLGMGVVHHDHTPHAVVHELSMVNATKKKLKAAEL